MNSEDRRFHTIYGVMLLCSFFVDPFFQTLAPAWKSPQLSIYTLAAALIWMTVWIWRRLCEEGGRRRALEERIKRLEGRLSEMEVERAPDPRWPS